jgi:hypothetical protein
MQSTGSENFTDLAASAPFLMIVQRQTLRLADYFRSSERQQPWVPFFNHFGDLSALFHDRKTPYKCR